MQRRRIVEIVDENLTADVNRLSQEPMKIGSAAALKFFLLFQKKFAIMKFTCSLKKSILNLILSFDVVHHELFGSD
jgi:hypothetical protein